MSGYIYDNFGEKSYGDGSLTGLFEEIRDRSAPEHSDQLSEDNEEYWADITSEFTFRKVDLGALLVNSEPQWKGGNLVYDKTRDEYLYEIEFNPGSWDSADHAELDYLSYTLIHYRSMES